MRPELSGASEQGGRLRALPRACASVKQWCVGAQRRWARPPRSRRRLRTAFRAPCRCIGVRRMTMVAPRTRCAVRGARAAVLLPRSAGPRVHEHTYVCSCAYSAAASGRFSADTSPCSECARWLRMLCMPPKAPPPLGKATNSSMLYCKSSIKTQL